MHCRVARILLVHNTKTGKMYKRTQNALKGYKVSLMAIKILQMAIKYIHILPSWVPQNLHKMGFLV
jgi:hypothetical protein